MDRDSLRPALLGLLVVLAIATAAATLTTPAVNEPGGGSGFGSNPDSSGVSTGDEESESDGFGLLDATGGEFTNRQICFPIFLDPWVIFGIIGVFALASAHTYRRVGIFGPVGVLGGLGIPVYLFIELLTACGGDIKQGGSIFSIGGERNLPSGGVTGVGGGDGGIVGETVATSVPSVVLTLLLGVALIAAVALFISATDDDVEEPEPDSAGPDADVAAVGRVAGSAADRIEDDADVTNEVFRAWREMTDVLPVDRPQSSTPAEFAAAAAEAGMARDDIDELTRLFEAVRYGGHEATGEREERAVAALRRIEATYAAGGDTTDATDPRDGDGR